jgi:OOP family OmpA-OmpF porin
MKKTMRSVIVLAAVAAAAPALAQRPMPYPSPWYIGVGAGQGTLDTNSNAFNDANNISVGSRESTYTVRGGWRFTPWTAIEIGYYDLGKYDFHARPVGTTANVDGQAKAKSYGVSFVGILPINQFDLYGRIGWVSTKTEVNASNNSSSPFNASDTRSEATYGVGAHWNFVPQWGLFAEWMKNDNVKVDSWMIGVDFRF